jgi:hypothetical protein
MQINEVKEEGEESLDIHINIDTCMHHIEHMYL